MVQAVDLEGRGRRRWPVVGLHLEAVLEGREQLQIRVLRRRRRMDAAVRVGGRRRMRRGDGDGDGVALVDLVAGVGALVGDVEDGQVGVRALHLPRRRAPLRRPVRAPVVTPALQQRHHSSSHLSAGCHDNRLDFLFKTNLLQYYYSLRPVILVSNLSKYGCIYV